MNRFIAFLLICAFFLVSCTTAPQQQCSAPSVETAQSINDANLIPGWLFEAMQNKFQQPELVEPGEINFLLVIRYASHDYRKVWTGISEVYNISAIMPWCRTVGIINLDMYNDELVYGEIKRYYDTTDFTADPCKVETRVRVFKFDEGDHKYVTVYD